MFKRKICKISNCKRQTRNKGFYKGKTRYDNVCSFHHSGTSPYWKKKIMNKKCERCGWDKAPCDRHRVVPSKGYVKSNVIVLCPNCHREEEYAKSL